jgi:hypothetical protein
MELAMNRVQFIRQFAADVRLDVTDVEVDWAARVAPTYDKMIEAGQDWDDLERLLGFQLPIRLKKLVLMGVNYDHVPSPPRSSQSEAPTLLAA